MNYIQLQKLRKQASMDQPTANKFHAQNALPDAGYGAAIGAGLGGLIGLVGPGKNRWRRALAFAAGGGLAGGLGAGLTSYLTDNQYSLANKINGSLDAARAKVEEWKQQRADAKNQAEMEAIAQQNMLDREPAPAEPETPAGMSGADAMQQAYEEDWAKKNMLDREPAPVNKMPEGYPYYGADQAANAQAMLNAARFAPPQVRDNILRSLHLLPEQ